MLTIRIARAVVAALITAAALGACTIVTDAGGYACEGEYIAYINGVMEDTRYDRMNAHVMGKAEARCSAEGREVQIVRKERVATNQLILTYRCQAKA